MRVPALVLQAGADEFVPGGAGAAAALAARLARAMPQGRAAVIPAAPHSLAGHSAEAVAAVMSLVVEVVRAPRPPGAATSSGAL